MSQRNFVVAGVALLWGSGLLAGCFNTVDEPIEEETVASESSEMTAVHIDERAICDGLSCDDPDGAAATCEAIWGASSGKQYSIFSKCKANENTTNSDCFSDCFRNLCQCGSTAGTPGACGDWPTPAQPNCHCFAGAPPIAHRFWCCGDATTTIDGWSDVDHCSNIPLPGAWIPGTTVVY